MNSPTPTLEADDLRVMQKSVEERACGGGVAQHLAPVLDGSVRRNQNGSRLIPAGEDLQQVHAGQLFDQFGSSTGGVGLGQVLGQIERRAVVCGVTSLNGGHRQTERNVALARA